MASQQRKSFTENIEILSEELKLAIRWNRPSILLAICKSGSTQTKAENELKNKIQQMGFSVVEIEANTRSPFISQQILGWRNRDRMVFFISHLDWGGGHEGKDAYKNLNMERETLVENQIKAIFWLTGSEALNLPVHAPDFWAFRHQMVEFSAARSGEKIKLPAGVLIWHGQQDISDTPERLKGRIEAYEKSIKDLPNSPESQSARIEFLYSIGYLHWLLGNTEKSFAALQRGANLVREPEFSSMRTWLFNGIAITYYERGEFKKAAQIYDELVLDSKKDGILRINHSITLCALGKNSDAVSGGKKAVNLHAIDARIWNRIGYVYVSAGKPDEAIPFFEKAIKLAPTSPIYYESIAICYYLLGSTEESLNQLKSAYKYAGNRSFFIKVCEEAIRGTPQKSIQLLKDALTSRQISILDMRYNFHSQMILDGSLFGNSSG